MLNHSIFEQERIMSNLQETITSYELEISQLKQKISFQN